MVDRAGDPGVYRTTFDPTEKQPNVDVTETVAELEGTESDQLSPLYECIDHVIDNIFSNPPEPEADVEVSFTYEGYRVIVSQDGDATFRPADE